MKPAGKTRRVCRRLRARSGVGRSTAPLTVKLFAETPKPRGEGGFLGRSVVLVARVIGHDASPRVDDLASTAGPRLSRADHTDGGNASQEFGTALATIFGEILATVFPNAQARLPLASRLILPRKLPGPVGCGNMGKEPRKNRERRMVRSFLMLGLLLAAAGLARAQSPAPDVPPGSDDPRFSYHRSEDGFVRLDRRTGQVSHCARRTSGWSCLAVPDDRAALEAEIGRLQSENAALKQALLDRGLPLPGAAKPGAPSAGAPQDEKPSGEAEADRVMSLVERIWRRLIEMMANLQRDLNKT